ncbi:lipase family protein [Myxacorys almedinensis]|uniref:Lipase family protein n=1 Tax=Myxacorys almedinensis A TaxID=2690445 RepID=A0A8J7Z0Q7_9CYAN|nr:lipase family protein [Myxacorys almedinensis]NDJ16051.1 lipase family protein [Myxacorys almedinensis A]
MDYSKALQCAILSREIYQDFASIRFSDFPSITPELISQADTDTQCAVFADGGNAIYIVFQGSTSDLDWETNLEFKQELVDFKQEVIQEQIVQDKEQVYPYGAESKSGAKMHKGFVTAYFSVRDQIFNYLRSRNVSRVTVTGHSLGGALATLCTVDLQFNFSGQFAIDNYTFGAPRVGNDGFVESFNRRIPDSFRFVYGMDIVAAIPRVWQGYRHVDQEYRLGNRFSLQFLSRRFKDHSIENYINELKKQAGR